MRKYFISSIALLVILSFLGSGINCRRHRAEEETPPREIAQKEAESPPGIERPIGKQRGKAKESQVVGKGYGRRGLGRGRGRETYEPIELSADEKEAIEIETIEVSSMSLRSHLQALLLYSIIDPSYLVGFLICQA